MAGQETRFLMQQPRVRVPQLKLPQLKDHARCSEDQSPCATIKTSTAKSINKNIKKKLTLKNERSRVDMYS